MLQADWGGLEKFQKTRGVLNELIGRRLADVDEGGAREMGQP